MDPENIRKVKVEILPGTYQPHRTNWKSVSFIHKTQLLDYLNSKRERAMKEGAEFNVINYSTPQ